MRSLKIDIVISFGKMEDIIFAQATTLNYFTSGFFLMQINS